MKGCKAAKEKLKHALTPHDHNKGTKVEYKDTEESDDSQAQSIVIQTNDIKQIKCSDQKINTHGINSSHKKVFCNTDESISEIKDAAICNAEYNKDESYELMAVSTSSIEHGIDSSKNHVCINEDELTGEYKLCSVDSTNLFDSMSTINPQELSFKEIKVVNGKQSISNKEESNEYMTFDVILNYKSTIQLADHMEIKGEFTNPLKLKKL
eukprot:TRINITY_DN9253_c0_g4_i1.p1 TRINITY_DN9253_c0_g4~~TRINITY_DN9253_c0_g4_i1.p1  ORF type:complete len:239 (-),score=28.95 TRINITY_DN9253_c0_g4_i1:39-668(-)